MERVVISGAYGEVHLEGSVATKFISRDSSEDYISAYKEIAVSRMCAHSNICPVRAEVTPTHFELKMPRYATTLHARIEAGDLTPQDMCRAVVDVVAGLAAVHSIGCIHCDIKSANIFMAVDGHSVLGDFGICSFNELKRDNNVQTTPYRAPEIRTGADPSYDTYHFTSAIDMWSVGILMLEMLCSRYPYVSHYDTSSEYITDLFGTCEPLDIHDSIDLLTGRVQSIIGDRVQWACTAGYITLAAQCLNINPRLRPTAASAHEDARRILAQFNLHLAMPTPRYLRGYKSAMWAVLIDDQSSIPVHVANTAAGIFAAGVTQGYRDKYAAQCALWAAAAIYSFPKKLWHLSGVTEAHATKYMCDIGWPFHITTAS